jgi:hypothetical protein
MRPSRLQWLYVRERTHDQFVFHITNLLRHVDAFSDFISANQNLDMSLEVEEADKHLQLRALYESCRMAALYLDQQWQVDSPTPR